jgi:hypothetical protein
MKAHTKQERIAGTETVEDAIAALQPQLTKLRKPFPAHQIAKLPKETGAQAKQRKADQDAGKWPPKCDECGGYHHPKAVHLDYVGHAALTDRLLDTDLEWSWEPVGFTPEGLPALDRNGGLWIKLTVCGVTRYGYGAADGKSGGDAMKEMIGDALRNAAMRFGAALDLWHKGDLHADNDKTETVTTGEKKPRERVKYEGGPYTCPTQLQTAAREFVRTLNSMGDLGEFIAWSKTQDVKDFVAQLKKEMPDWWSGGPSVPSDFVPLEILTAQKKRDLEQIDEIRTKEQV